MAPGSPSPEHPNGALDSKKYCYVISQVSMEYSWPTSNGWADVLASRTTIPSGILALRIDVSRSIHEFKLIHCHT